MTNASITVGDLSSICLRSRLSTSPIAARMTAQLKRKMRPAIEELVEHGFLKESCDEERFRRQGRGKWTVVFEKASDRIGNKTSTQAEPPLVERLVAHGVRLESARQLLQCEPVERIEQQLAVFDWLLSRNDKRISKNPPGFLVSAIRGDFKAPNDYPVAQHDRQQRAKLQSRPVSMLHSQSSSVEPVSTFESTWNTLPLERQREIEAAAMASAPTHYLEGYERSHAAGQHSTAESYRQLILERFLSTMDPLSAK